MKYKVNNVIYGTIEKLSDKFGVSVFLIERRLAVGKTIEEAVGIKTTIKDDRFICYGREYPSLSLLAKNLGVDVSCIELRVLRGMTIEKAVTDILKPKPKNYHSNGKNFSTIKERDKYKRALVKAMFPIVYQGMTFRTRNSLAQHVGMASITLINRLSQRMPVEVAIKHEQYSVVFDGEYYSNMSLLSRKLNISISAIKYRLEQGYTLEDAVSELLLKKGE